MEEYTSLKIAYPDLNLFFDLLQQAKAGVETPEHKVFLQRLEENFTALGGDMLITRVHRLRLQQLASGAIK